MRAVGWGVLLRAADACTCRWCVGKEPPRPLGPKPLGLAARGPSPGASPLTRGTWARCALCCAVLCSAGGRAAPCRARCRGRAGHAKLLSACLGWQSVQAPRSAGQRHTCLGVQRMYALPEPNSCQAGGEGAQHHTGCVYAAKDTWAGHIPLLNARPPPCAHAYTLTQRPFSLLPQPWQARIEEGSRECFVACLRLRRCAAPS